MDIGYYSNLRQRIRILDKTHKNEKYQTCSTRVATHINLTYDTKYPVVKTPDMNEKVLLLIKRIN